MNNEAQKDSAAGINEESSCRKDVLRMSSDADLVSAAQSGRAAAFGELARRYSGRLYKFVYRRTGSAADSEDIVQDTFVRAYENIDKYQSMCKFSTWLFTIASRLATDHFRRSHPMQRIGEVVSNIPGPSGKMEAAETKRGIWSLARQLSENQFQVLDLRYCEGLSIKEVAQVTGKTEIHVKVLLYRARANMASKLRNLDMDVDTKKHREYFKGNKMIHESAGV